MAPLATDWNLSPAPASVRAMPSHRTLLLLLLLVPPLLQGGCASARKKQSPEPAAPRPVYVGMISLVNADSGFVLIDGGLLPSPPPGLALRSFTNGAMSAELASSEVRKRPFVIADIKTGAPQKGDRVFTAVAGPQPSTIPTAAPTLPPPALRLPPPEEPAPDFLPPVQLAPEP